MLGRFVTRVAVPAVKSMKFTVKSSVRSFGAAPAASAQSVPSDVVVPELFDTLEWTLSSPPPVHQFTEQPIIVEIEHLENLKPEEVVYED